MKKSVLFLLIGVLSLPLWAQKNDLLPTEQRIAYVVFFPDSTTLNKKIFENQRVLKNTQHTPAFFGKILTEKALAGEIQTYSPSDIGKYYPYDVFESPKISPNEIKHRLGGGIDTLLVLDPETDELDTVIAEIEIYPQEIQSLYFIENWQFNAEKFTFGKQVLGIVPIRHFYRHKDIDQENILLKKVFRLLFRHDLSRRQKRKIEKRWVNCNTVSYEQMLVNRGEVYDSQSRWFQMENAPFFTGFSRYKLIEAVVQKAISGEKPAFDFRTGEKLSVEQVKRNMGGGSDTIIVSYGEQRAEKIVERDPRTDQVKSVVFIEDWFYDPQTLRMKKVVKGIAPVRWYFSDSDIDHENLLKKIAFTIYFNQP